MGTTPSGWYDDGHGTMRWWDGARWTDHVAPAGTDTHVDVPPPADGGFAPQGSAVTDSPPVAPPAPIPPTKSKLWIVWAVLGVVVLGVLILAAVFIPRLFVGLLGQGAGAGGDLTADQQAAVAATQLYNDAWQDADCDAYMSSTTEAFRTQSGLTDCSAFESQAEAFAVAADDYTVTLVDVQEEGGTILVGTTETYTLLLDEEGTPLDEPSAESIDWVYIVVADGEDWLIDDMR